MTSNFLSSAGSSQHSVSSAAGLLRYTLSNGALEEVHSDGVIKLAAGEVVEFDLGSGGHWYGHGFSHVQPYPLESGTVVNPTFAVNNIQAPIWMCSQGVVLLAETTRVLDVRINEDGNGLLRICCPGAGVSLRVWSGSSLPESRQKLMAYLAATQSVPASNYFGDSFFCTWTQYPRCLDQDRIVGMGEEIHRRGYPCSTLIIDDRWESCFGELEFGPDIPDPASMVQSLHALGIQVWLWVTPFVNVEAKGFDALAADGVLVPSRKGAGAALFKWWGGTAGLIDVTAPQGRAWLKGKLETLQSKYGVDGFKIDGGDFKYQPSPQEADWHAFAGESGYSDQLLEVFEELIPNACESRTAWLSQNRSIIWRLGGKDSHWGLDNGLAALVSLSLHLSLVGYDILIPDMVPGRVQTMQADDPLPSDELMLRWTEVSALMPMLQFSYFPWNYAEATEQSVRGYAKLHKALEEYLHEQASKRDAPLLRPVWYESPAEAHLYTILDTYQLGSDLLVAPVLESGATSRDICIPPGAWVDAWTGAVVESGWLRDYPAPCPGIPLFVRQECDSLRQVLQSALGEITRGHIQDDTCSASYMAGLDRDLSVTG